MVKAMTIKVEDPLQDEVAALLRQSDFVAGRLYPGEFRRPITPESLARPGTHLLVARLAGGAVGLCAVLERDSGEVELKRMIVDAKARGQGVGTALVRRVQAEAQRLGASMVVLEVGVRNVEAQALYRRAGFMLREAFQPHEPSPVSLFMECRG